MNKTPKMITCKHCGEEIAAGAKTCPKCGGKNKKVLYKRPWFIILMVLIVVGVVGEIISSNEAEKAEYTKYEVGQLMDDLEENASKASEKHVNEYVEITGKLSNIDSDSSYIDVADASDEWAILGVQCYTNGDEEIIAKIKEYKKDQAITVKGKITDVGEVMGYSLDIVEIK